MAVIPGLPRAVVIPMDARGRRAALGHFAPSTWRVHGPERAHEVAISPHLFGSPDDLLATLLHEAAHAWLYVASDDDAAHVGGVGRDRRCHRREFRDACRHLGLACEFHNGRYGWTATGWPETGVPDRYLTVLRILGQLPWGASRVACDP